MTGVQLETVPVTCLVSDVCRLLRISRAQFFVQRQRLEDLGVLVKQVPQIDRKLRYLGAPIAVFLGVQGQEAQTRRVLQAAAQGGRS